MENPISSLLGSLQLIDLIAAVSGGFWVLVCFLKWPRYTLLAAILVKPAMDVFWWVGMGIEPWTLVSMTDRPDEVMNPSKFHGMLIFLLSIAIFCIRPNLRQTWKKVMFLFVLGTVFAFAANSDPRGLRDLMRVISAVMVLILADDLFDSYREFRIFCSIYLILMLIPYTVGTLQIAGVIPASYQTFIDEEPVARITSGYYHPIDSFKYLYFSIFFAMFFLTSERDSALMKGLLLVHVGYALVLMWASIYRTGFVILLIATMLYFVLNRKWGITAFLGILLTLGVVFFTEQIWNLFSDLYEKVYLQGKYEDIFHKRGAIWMDHLAHFSQQSYFNKLFGAGLYTDLSDVRYYNFLSRTHNDPHNDYLRLLVEQGIVGLTLWITAIFLLTKELIVIQMRHASAHMRSLSTMPILAILAMLILSITSQATENTSFIQYLAVVVAGSKIEVDQNRHAA